MNVILPLLWSKFSFFSKIVKDRDWTLGIVVFGFFFIAFLVAAATFAFLWRGFIFLKDQPVFGEALMVYALEAGFAIVFSLLVVSSISSGLSVLFRSSELSFLASRPVSFPKLFSYGFLKNFLISSWPVMVLGTPAIFALGLVYARSFWFYVLAFFGAFVFSLIAIALGTFCALIFGALIPRINRTYLWAALLTPLVILGILFAQSIVPVHFEAMFRADVLEEEVVSTIDIERNFQWWPSHIFVNLFRNATQNAFASLLQLVVSFTLFAGFAVLILGSVAKKTYFALWAKFQETSFVAGGSLNHIVRRPRGIPHIIPGEFGVMLWKDLFSLLRNSNTFYSLGFLLFLLFFYVLGIVRVVNREETASSQYLPLLIALTVAIIGYFAAIFALRFVFPAISREGKSAWVLWSSPFRLHTMIWEKFLFYSFLFAVLLEALFLFSSRFLIDDLFITLVLSIMVAMMVATICACALGLGSALPDFRYDDAERLSNTPGGLGVVFLSILYVGAISFLGYMAAKGSALPISLGIAVILSGVLSFYFLRLAFVKIRYIR